MAIKKIHNPFLEKDSYTCFGCAPKNPIGLQMEFYKDGNDILSYWTPDKYHNGWEGILHGGVVASLMDEAGAWVLFTQIGTSGVTTDMQIKYLKPVKIPEGRIVVRACLHTLHHRIAKVKTRILNKDKNVCAHAEIRYYCFPEEVAKKNYAFPGKSQFYAE